MPIESPQVRPVPCVRAASRKAPRLLFRFVLVVVGAGSMAALAQTPPSPSPLERSESLWTPGATVQRSQASRALAARATLPSHYRLMTLDRQGMFRRLTSRTDFLLPLPDGRMEPFRPHPSRTMPPGLAARYPGIRVVRATGVNDSRLEASVIDGPNGFGAWISGPDGVAIVDPVATGDLTTYLVYRRREVTARAESDFECNVHRRRPVAARLSNGPMPLLQTTGQAASTPVAADRRTYVLALAATGEYTQFHGGTVAGTLAEMVRAIDRVNMIYGAELGVTLVLHPNTDQLIYTNAGSDPYTGDDVGVMIDENRDNLNTTLGVGTFDMGHVLSQGAGGGVASIASVCWNTEKARGATSLISPVGDPFYVDYLAHELGHQLGADHSFNGSTGLCGGQNQRVGSIAFEPGSGTTIMSYAGICGAENLQSQSDPYFHFSSLSDIEAYISDPRPTWGGDPSCVAVTATGNMTPSVDAGPDLIIPVETPFEMTGTATDDVGVASYVWEQADVGPATTGGSLGTDDGLGPIFRSRQPGSSPTRTFPRMIDVLSGATSPGEILPTAGRLRPNALTLKFVVRDADLRGGGWGIDEVEIEIDPSSGPFRVVSPNGGGTASGMTVVSWSVAGTDTAPVFCSQVDIFFSADGGATFDTPLAAGAANDGSQVVVLPPVTTVAGRLLVRCSDSVFFDVSDSDFAVVPATSLLFEDGFESGDVSSWSAP